MPLPQADSQHSFSPWRGGACLYYPLFMGKALGQSFAWRIVRRRIQFE